MDSALATWITGRVLCPVCQLLRPRGGGGGASVPASVQRPAVVDGQRRGRGTAQGQACAHVLHGRGAV